MRRRISLWVSLITALLLVTAAPAVAQSPGSGPGPGGGYGPGPFRESPPSAGGVGIMVMDRDRDREQLLTHLRLQECEPQYLAVTVGGRWRLYHPAAPDFVNRDFPLQFQAGAPFLVGCSGVRPSVRLTEADDGLSVSVDTGERLRVVLESNPSTGYAWVLASSPDTTVLQAVGQPFSVPPVTDLLGAPGYQVFDFEAIAAGTTSVQLSYVRASSEPPADAWSVTVVVQ